MQIKKLVKRLESVTDELQMSQLTMVELQCKEDVPFLVKKSKGVVNQFTAGEVYIASILRTGTHEIDNDAGGLARFAGEEIEKYFRRIG